MYILQWLNGSIWSDKVSGCNEQSILIQGKHMTNVCKSGRKYRIVFREGRRESVVHIF